MTSLREQYELRKKRHSVRENGVATDGITSLQERYKAWRRENKGAELAADMQSRVQSWMDEHNSFLKSYSDRFGGRSGDYSTVDYTSDAQDWYDNASAKGGALNDTVGKLLEDLQRDSYIYGDDYVKAVSEMLTSGQDLYTDVVNIAKGDVDFWAQFDPTEQQKTAGYDTAEKVYDAWRTDNKYRTKHEGKSRDEISRAILHAEDEAEADWLRKRETELWTSADEQARIRRQNDILAEYEADLERYDNAHKNLGAGSQVKEMIIEDINEKYGSRTELREKISRLKAEITVAGRNQSVMEMTEVSDPESDRYDSEFSSFATYDPEIDSGDYAYLNMSPEERVAYRRESIYADVEEGNETGDSAVAEHFEKLDQLTADEIAIYNYYVNTGATDKAAAYLELLGDTMNARIGANIFSHIEGQPLAELAYSAVAGIDQFKSGMEGLGRSFVGDDRYTPTSALQYAGGMAREDLGNVDLKWYDFKEGGWKDADIFGSSLGQGLYDLGTTTANMAPSILTSTAIGLINPAAGQITGAALLGGSAAGNAYQEKINLGYSADSARAYGYMVGASEAVLEYAIGGVSKLGGKAMGAISTKMLDKIDNVLAKAAKTAGGKILMAGTSEAFEEGLQSIIEPYIWQAVSGEEAQVDWEETLYSSLLGFMTGGMFEGVENVQKNVQQNTQTKEYYGESQLELVTEALEIDPANAYAQKMQKILDSGKDLTGKQLNKLVQQNDAAIEKMENTTSKESGVKYKLVEYSQEQKANWASSKRIVLYEGIEQFKNFIKNALTGENKTNKKMYLGAVDSQLAAAIATETGVEVEGYNLALGENEIRKINKDHGSEETEAPRGQRAVTEADYLKVPDVIQSPDSIKLSEKQYNGKPVIEFRQTIGNETTVVAAVVSDKRLDLFVQTTYINKKSGSIATPKSEHADFNTPEASSGTAPYSSISDSVAGVNGENVDPVAQLARETVDARYDAENGAGLDGISAEGRAIYEDQAVDVVGIDTAGGGKVTVKLADGRSVDATALEYEDSGEAELWRVIGKYAEDADSARALLDEYRNGDLDAYKYARGIEEAFLFGKLNLSPKEMELQGSYVNLLDPAQRNMAYQQGKIAGEKKGPQTRQQQERIDAVYKQAKSALQQKSADAVNHDVQLADGLTVEKMGRTQRPSYELAKMIAPAVKADMRIYDGGKEWGYYDHEADTICLNINAKWSGASMMSFTLAHELVHRAKLGSPVKYQAFADFLIQQYGEQGASVNDMVQEQMQAAEENDISMTYEEAFEEVICDACQKMLVDTDAGKKLAEFGAKSEQNKNIVKQFAQQLKELLQKLRRIFRNVEPDSLAAQEFQRFDDNVKQILADMFVDMSMDAGEKLSAIKAAGMTEKITTDEGGVKKKFASTQNDTYRKPAYDEWDVNDALDDSLDHADQHNDNLIKVGNMPNFITDLCGIEGEFYIYRNHAYENMVSMKDAEKAKRPTMRGGKEIHFHNLGKQRMIDAILSLEHPIMTINDSQQNGNPQIVMLLPVRGNNDAPLYAALSFYSDVKINGKFTKKPHIVLTISERAMRGSDGFDGHLEVINKAIAKGNVLSFDKEKMRDYLSVIANHTRVGNITSKSLINNIAQFRKFVNEFREKNKINYKLPAGKDAADRGMLVDLFEQMVTDSNEYKALQNYKKNINQMLALEEKIDRLTEEIKRVSFAEGPRDMEYLNNLKQQRKKAVAELNRYDNILLGLEKSGVLRTMIERNRKTIQQETRDQVREYYRQKNETREAEIRQYYRESRRKAVERHNQAEVRQRIRKDVQRLDSLLNKGTKEKNVKMELKEFAGAALRTAKGTFLKNYNEYEMVRSGVNATMSREQKAVFARAQELLKELDHIREQRDNAPAADNLHEKWDPEAQLRRDDREEALKKELAKNMKVLRDAGIFRLENELMEDANSDQLMDELMGAYAALKDSDAAHVRGVYSEVVYGQFEKIKDFLGGKAIKDMTGIELAELHKMYRMVLHTIDHSNDLFAQKRKMNVEELGEAVVSQLQTPGKEMTAEVLDKLAKMGWANLKPETALELIGSDALTEMMQGLYWGEDTYALDIDHARQYAEEQGKKYGRDKWDMKKSLAFANTKITLGEAMSLYAYTRRQQAQGHLEGDGFTHSSNVRIKEALGKLPVELSYIRNATKTHSVPKDVFDRVAQMLTPEQRKYVEAMQEYLSQVMGNKGNEVSMQLYGIKLFEETVYFPLKTAQEYHDEALGATTGEVKLKNSGFTKKVQDKASNPIVLDDFESVWAAHVDKMSLYHGFVLPMEDFDRVYNYHHQIEQGITDSMGEVYKKVKVDTNETVKVAIQNKMGKVANEYIEDFMRQLNGGVRTDSTEKLFGTGMRNFKKAAVMASLSVAVQQPTAFIRAMAYLDPADIADWKQWLGKKGKPEGKLLDEMYKYAAVSLMKKIGGFDPSLGRSTGKYIFKDKGVMSAVDTVAGWLPEHMDQWTWTYIWICTKRQIHRQNPDLKVNSEAFLQKAGERFSKIIRDTQVYDSVLTKSQLMRSKSVFLQMATAFMNEPSTSMDMYIRSTIQAKRGKISKKQAARTWGAVAGSQILVAAVSAFVYAGRDDDDDETYWEKYVSSFINKTKEGLLPFYSIPFVKDIISVFEGYSSERSDMSLITDLYQGWQKLKSDNATPWEKVEAFAGSILNCFGIPLKNVSRDVRAIFNTVKTWSDVQGTGTGMKHAAIKGLTGKEATKKKQMAKAVAEGDTDHIIRLMATCRSEDSAVSAVRSGVKDAYLRGKITEDVAVEFLQVYAGDDAADAQEKMTYWEFLKEYPELELDQGPALKYVEFAEPVGISTEIYAEYCEEKAGYSKREDILQVIHKLPISKKQKDALYFAEGYAESTLDDAPWH